MEGLKVRMEFKVVVSATYQLQVSPPPQKKLRAGRKQRQSIGDVSSASLREEGGGIKG